MGSGTDTNAGTAISLDADGDLKIGDKKLLKEDENQKIPSEKLPISVTHSDNVLSTLTIGDNTYNMSSGGSGGGSTLTVQDEGSSLATAATTLNFTGSGVTASGTGATKTITINNELTNWSEDANGHIIPATNATYDIGSAEKKVRHLYLSQNSLYMGSGTDTNAGTAIFLMRMEI